MTLTPFAAVVDVTAGRLLVATVVVLAATATVLAAVLVHAAVASVLQRRWATRLPPLRRALVAATLGTISTEAATDALRHTTRRERIRLLVAAGRSLTGAERQRLHEVARHLGVVDQARRSCRSRAWYRRLHGVRLLQVVGGGRPVIPHLVADRDAHVRREAVRWLAERADVDDVRLILQLADRHDWLDEPSIVDALVTAGRTAIGPIRDYLAAPSGGVLPVLRAAAGVPDPAYVPGLAALAQHPLSQVRTQVAHVAGAIGTDDARLILQRLLLDPVARVRRAAVDALTRNGDWRAAALVRAGLMDDDPRVRHSAALGLVRLGAAGLLLLRDAVRSGVEPASSMAHQMIDRHQASAGGA